MPWQSSPVVAGTRLPKGGMTVQSNTTRVVAFQLLDSTYETSRQLCCRVVSSMVPVHVVMHGSARLNQPRCSHARPRSQPMPSSHAPSWIVSMMPGLDQCTTEPNTSRPNAPSTPSPSLAVPDGGGALAPPHGLPVTRTDEFRHGLQREQPVVRAGPHCCPVPFADTT